MKVTEANSNAGEILYYELRTKVGSNIGAAFPNDSPWTGDNIVTLEDAKKNATLWASAPDLLEALEEYISVSDDTVAFEYPEIFKRATDAIKKARGI